jgi:hypothetical protein
MLPAFGTPCMGLLPGLIPPAQTGAKEWRKRGFFKSPSVRAE